MAFSAGTALRHKAEIKAAQLQQSAPVEQGEVS